MLSHKHRAAVIPKDQVVHVKGIKLQILLLLVGFLGCFFGLLLRHVLRNKVVTELLVALVDDLLCGTVQTQEECAACTETAFVAEEARANDVAVLSKAQLKVLQEFVCNHDGMVFRYWAILFERQQMVFVARLAFAL